MSKLKDIVDKIEHAIHAEDQDLGVGALKELAIHVVDKIENLGVQLERIAVALEKAVAQEITHVVDPAKVVPDGTAAAAGATTAGADTTATAGQATTGAADPAAGATGA